MARKTREKKTAGALDVRNIIGMLMATYGVILIGMGLIADPETDKTGGLNANLWTGVSLLAFGLGFLSPRSAASLRKPSICSPSPARMNELSGTASRVNFAARRKVA